MSRSKSKVNLALNNERLCSLPERLKAPSPNNKTSDIPYTAMEHLRISKEPLQGMGHALLQSVYCIK
jgi:hypothetical protein